MSLKALVSRSRIFQLYSLTGKDIRLILERAISDPVRGYGNRKLTIDPDAFQHLVEISGGDARNALNALELAVESTKPDSQGLIHIDIDIAQESIQKRAVLYDRNGDAHYDTISAFIKSVRGSDPDAALYWLAKMLHAGEDPRFILRRLIVLAGEDIGLADPMGIVVASAAASAFEYIGFLKASIPSLKPHYIYPQRPNPTPRVAYFKPWKEFESDGIGDVPIHLMDGNRDGKGLGHGKGYQYPHDYPWSFHPSTIPA